MIVVALDDLIVLPKSQRAVSQIPTICLNQLCWTIGNYNRDFLCCVVTIIKPVHACPLFSIEQISSFLILIHLRSPNISSTQVLPISATLATNSRISPFTRVTSYLYITIPRRLHSQCLHNRHSHT